MDGVTIPRELGIIMPQVALPIFTLKRTHKRPNGVYSIFDHEGDPFAVCAEHSSLHIPSGEYNCERSFYNSGKYETFEIKIKDRTRILFHKGNIGDEDSKGCILVAESFGIVKGKVAIISSREGFGEFMELLNGKSAFKLIIQDYFDSTKNHRLD